MEFGGVEFIGFRGLGVCGNPGGREEEVKGLGYRA